jgi:CBS-domain-containing membrane protein
MKCSAIMKTDVECCPRGEIVETAAERMLDRNVGFKSRIVRADDRRRPVGIISLSDLAQVEDSAKVSHALGSIAAREASPPHI